MSTKARFRFFGATATSVLATLRVNDSLRRLPTSTAIFRFVIGSNERTLWTADTSRLHFAGRTPAYLLGAVFFPFTDADQMIIRRLSRLGTCLVALLLSIAGRASGQVPVCVPVTISPVEVVATRIPEAPHDVPASIEVISGSDLRARGVRSLRDALALSTGVA